MRIYGDLNSGNGLKVKYAADFLGLRYAWAPVDIAIADIARPAYTRLADEGGFDLNARPNVSAWISACEHRLALPARKRG
ncbi:MAG: hypothetical protein LDL25_02150 [Hyphomicrobiales bacterium]|uniref:hypothetical protein n=1 Tax=Rhabdaerophilum calidifontis TaxID=2604328 RepID=UPI001239CE8F|nr:hypothetical protein [Rhabdaerophilum calidifontis]MCA1998569.1 hypothetical protein [Hyphomicrobiales bacterium]